MLNDTERTPLVRALRAYRRRDLGRRCLEAVTGLALLGWLLVVLLALLERLFEPSLALRGAMGGGLCATLVASLGAGLLHVLRGPGDVETAWAIERGQAGRLGARLATAVELGGRPTPGVDPQLVALCARQAAGILEQSSLGEGISYQLPRRRAGLLVVLVAGFGLLVGYHPLTHYHLLSRFLAPALGIELPVPVRFTVEPGEARLLAGTRFAPRCRVTGEARGELVAVRRLSTERAQERVTEPDSDGVARADFGPVHESFDYHFALGAYRSRSFRVEVVSPPKPQDVVLTFEFPAHTRLPPRTQRGGDRDVVAPKGSRVHLRAGCNRPLLRAALRIVPRGGGEPHEVPATLGQDPTTFEAVLPVEESGTWQIVLEDVEHFADPAPGIHRLVAEEDAVPKVYVLEPGKDLDVGPGPGPALAVRVHATDGFGLRELSLEWTLHTRRAFKDQESRGRIPVELSGGPTDLTTAISLDLTGLALAAGDEVSYRARARDSRPGEPEDGAAYSHRYRIQVPFARDEHAQLSEQEEAQAAGLEALAEEQRDWEKRLDRTLRDVSADGEISWKERRELESLMQENKELRRKVQDLAAQMRESFEEAKQAGILDPEIEKKMAEVQKLLHKLADEDMHERMKELQELLSQVKVDPGKMKELRKRYEKEAHSKSLDRMLEALKKLKTQREIEKAKAETEALRQDQEKLQEETARRAEKGEDTSPLAEEQAALEKRAEELVKELEQLAGSMGEESEDARKDVEDARDAIQKGDSALEQMQKAEQQLSQGRPQDAETSQSKAARRLRQAESALQQASAGLQSQRRSVNLEQVVAMVRLGLAVSHRQEGVVQDSFDDQKDPRQQCRRLASDQDTLYRGVSRFEGKFEDSLEDELELKEQLLTAVSDLVDDFREAKVAFEQVRPFTARQLARTSMVKLNQILAQLLDIQEEMQDSMAQAAMQQMMETLERMSRQQEMLNQRTERLQRDEGEAQRQREMAQQMAEDQGQLSEELERLRQEAEAHKETEGMAGKLGQMGKDMKEVEEALRQMEITEELRRKQRTLMTRMLELATSLQKQGESKEREARAALPFRSPAPPPAPPDLAEARRRFFENQEREGSPLEDREAVDAYLDLLSEEGAAPDMELEGAGPRPGFGPDSGLEEERSPFGGLDAPGEGFGGEDPREDEEPFGLDPDLGP